MSFDVMVQDVMGRAIVRDTVTINSGKQLLLLGEFLDQLNDTLAFSLLEAKIFGRQEFMKLGKKYTTKFLSSTGRELIERFGLVNG